MNAQHLDAPCARDILGFLAFSHGWTWLFWLIAGRWWAVILLLYPALVLLAAAIANVANLPRGVAQPLRAAFPVGGYCGIPATGRDIQTALSTGPHRRAEPALHPRLGRDAASPGLRRHLRRCGRVGC